MSNTDYLAHKCGDSPNSSKYVALDDSYTLIKDLGTVDIMAKWQFERSQIADDLFHPFYGASS